MKKAKTFQATIHCGLKNRATGYISSVKYAKGICQKMVDETGWCVSCTPTDYIYTDGHEPGVIIGILNYPRFPEPEASLRCKTIDLANRLLVGLNQLRLSIVFPDETVMLEVTEDKGTL